MKVKADDLATDSAESKNGSTGTRSWRLASGLAEWMSASHVRQRTAASALHVTEAGACSQTSHIQTRSCLDASLLAEWILLSQSMHRKAESARQKIAAAEDLHESHGLKALKPPLWRLCFSIPTICEIFQG